MVVLRGIAWRGTPPGRRARRPLVRVAVLLLTALSARGATAHAQSTITVTPTSLNFGTATETQYNAGASASMTLSWTVSTCNGTPKCMVKIRGTAFNGRPVSDVQWSTDGTTWTDMSTSDAIVDNNVQKGKTKTGTIFLRFKLSYATDPAGTYTPAVTVSVTQ